MNKFQAIQYVKEHNGVTLIEALLDEGDTSSVMSIIQNCWGYDDSDIIEWIENEWEF